MKFFRLAIFGVVVSIPARAQQGTPHNCEGMLTATVASGRPHGNLAECGSALVPELVRLIEAAPSETRVERLANLAMYGSYVRDPAILKAALTLARSDAASGAARAAGLLLGLSQHQRGLLPSGAPSYEALLTEPLPDACYLRAATGSSYWVEGPLDASALKDLVGAANAIESDSSAPLVPRRLARCIVRNLSALSMSEPDLTAVRLSYRCGHTYAVENGTSSYLSFMWTVEASDQTGGVTVAPHSREEVWVEAPGVLRLEYEGRHVASVSADERPCP